ncbi:hypothetical protein C5167_005915 [Papaver somniferum]|uniref:Uncharacterized protein n=1 Tax=Papaver somniferum TaxID=3469 RepID=A0A4Y7JFM9_PAPSO|nr:hypothetical protein C5167_005915 [Papaver somniferum]
MDFFNYNKFDQEEWLNLPGLTTTTDDAIGLAPFPAVIDFQPLHYYHADALNVEFVVQSFAIQRKERVNGVDTLAHQKWSGANYYDRVLKTVQGGISSTAAMGKGGILLGLLDDHGFGILRGRKGLSTLE